MLGYESTVISLKVQQFTHDDVLVSLGTWQGISFETHVVACGDRFSSSSPKRASRSGPSMARQWGSSTHLKCEHRRFGPTIDVAVAHLDSCHAAKVKFLDSDSCFGDEGTR